MVFAGLDAQDGLAARVLLSTLSSRMMRGCCRTSRDSTTLSLRSFPTTLLTSSRACAVHLYTSCCSVQLHCCHQYRASLPIMSLVILLLLLGPARSLCQSSHSHVFSFRSRISSAVASRPCQKFSVRRLVLQYCCPQVCVCKGCSPKLRCFLVPAPV